MGTVDILFSGQFAHFLLSSGVLLDCLQLNIPIDFLFLAVET